ncbi:N-acetylmuramoyl-L-alanine amidase [Veillonella sp.]|uniref:peptidoglycan recognition protein family protein n=1 Tax=Veillonella sp. TaxID=1926307 RepID=UPI0025E2A522|nr:N-acetylmuramoyl-L-alanine amidase [Veillonella sp.]
MKQVTLQDLKDMAKKSYYDLWGAAKSLNRDVKIYLHWTAGRYDQLFSDYHILITGNGSVYVSTDNLNELKKATYMRNTGSIAIALCCGYDAENENHLGNYPPTQIQLVAMAQVICVLADALDLIIDLNRVMTHAEAAKNKDGLAAHDDYGPYSGDPDTRWDLWVVKEGEAPWSGGDYLRGAANWWRGQRLLRG